MIARLLLAAAAVLATPGAAAPPQPAPTPDPQQVTERADAATPRPTATIRFGTDPRQVGELRVPAGNGPFPVAVVIHGGCWVAELGGTGMKAFSEALRRRGIATWDINYRRLGHPGGGWPGTFQDIAAGIDRLPPLARRYPLDLTRVTAVGHSAGALFSLWAGARDKLKAPWRAGPGAPHFRSVVAIDGPGSLAPMIGADKMVCGKPVIVPLMGGTPAERPDAYRIGSPAEHLPLGLTQLFVLAELAPFMEDYVAQARASGDPVTTLRPAGANHFDIVTPGTPNGEAVADWIRANAFK